MALAHTITFYMELFFVIVFLPYLFDIDFVSVQFAINCLEYSFLMFLTWQLITEFRSIFFLPLWGWGLYLPLAFVIMLVINGKGVPIKMRYLLIKHLSGCIVIISMLTIISRLEWMFFSLASWTIVVLAPFSYHYLKYRMGNNLFIVTRTGLLPIYLISMLPPSRKKAPVFLRIKEQQRCILKLAEVKKELERTEQSLKRNRIYIVDTHTSILNRIRENEKYHVLYSDKLLTKRIKKSRLVQGYPAAICNDDVQNCEHKMCIAGISDIFEEMIFVLK